MHSFAGAQGEERATVSNLQEEKHRILGIIGGMGPEATIELFSRIVKATPANCDQEHIHILIDNDPQIPDRTAAILGRGPDPFPALSTAARRLERAGASLLIMPCNTAHYWMYALRQSVSIPILDMIGLTAERIQSEFQAACPIGILATEGTVRAGLYQRALQSAGFPALLPDPDVQELVTNVIYSVKAGDHGEASKLGQVGRKLADCGARGLILGCTELSVLAHSVDFSVASFDPLQALAERAVAVMRN